MLEALRQLGNTPFVALLPGMSVSAVVLVEKLGETEVVLKLKQDAGDLKAGTRILLAISAIGIVV